MKQINGWLISNGSLQSAVFLELLGYYKEAAQKLGIELKIVFNHEIVFGVTGNRLSWKHIKEQEAPDFVLFLDKDIKLARLLEKVGMRVFNPSSVIEICDDKAKTFEILADKGIRMPDTIFSPLMFKKVDEEDSFISRVEEELGYPMVVKECFGSFGEQVYLVNNRDELLTKRRELVCIPHLYQRFVATSKGRDVRLYVVGHKVAACMLRTSEDDFRANITRGGRATAFEPQESFKEMAMEISKALKADFLGIDLLFDKNEDPILCEVNSNAHIKGIQECTGVNIAELIFKHILEHMSKKI